MTQRFMVTTVPDFSVGAPPDLKRARRIIDQNFRSLSDAINRAVDGGDLVAPSSVTLAMLAAEVLANSGDVSGTHPAHTVVGLRDKSLPAAPTASEDGQAIVWDDGSDAWAYTSLFTDPMTTRGDMLRRGASATERFALGASYTILGSDGNDPTWQSLSSLLDNAIGSTRGSILYRGASGWAILTPGTSGDVLTANGAGADPSYQTPSSGTPPTDFDLLTNGVDELVFAGGDVVWIT